jgi:hypothetical protein
MAALLIEARDAAAAARLAGQSALEPAVMEDLLTRGAWRGEPAG